MNGPIVYDLETGACQFCMTHHRWRVVAWLHWRWLCSPLYNWLEWRRMRRRLDLSWCHWTMLGRLWLRCGGRWWRGRSLARTMKRVYESPEARAAIRETWDRGAIGRAVEGFSEYRPRDAAQDDETGLAARVIHEYEGSAERVTQRDVTMARLFSRRPEDRDE